jgi:hypothetical protein
MAEVLRIKTTAAKEVVDLTCTSSRRRSRVFSFNTRIIPRSLVAHGLVDSRILAGDTGVERQAGARHVAIGNADRIGRPTERTVQVQVMPR